MSPLASVAPSLSPGATGARRRAASAQSRDNDHDRAEVVLARLGRCEDAADGQRLRDEVVLLTLDLADSVARRFRGRGIDSDDLCQVARLALVKAVRGYRCGHGSSFAAYAVPTISGEVKRHFRDCGWAVRPPRRLQEVRAELMATEDHLRHEFRRNPTTEELADALGVAQDQVEEARECGVAYRAVSLDAPGPQGKSLEDLFTCGTPEFDSIEWRDALRHALAELTERERLIVVLRFVDEQTQAEIGRVIGVSQMQVSRLLTGIIHRLRAEVVANAA